MVAMVLADGLFLEEARKAASAAGLRYEEALVDSLCAGLVLQPQAYDVLVAPNCWGDIVSDLAGGVVGSLGLLGSANVGASHALFEAAHGSAPHIAGRGVANPASMMLSAAMLMRHVGEARGRRGGEGNRGGPRRRLCDGGSGRRGVDRRLHRRCHRGDRAEYGKYMTLHTFVVTR